MSDDSMRIAAAQYAARSQERKRVLEEIVRLRVREDQLTKSIEDLAQKIRSGPERFYHTDHGIVHYAPTSYVNVKLLDYEDATAKSLPDGWNVLCKTFAIPGNPETGHVPGTNSGHGHVWTRQDGVRARCSGPMGCPQCASDAMWLQSHSNVRPSENVVPQSIEEHNGTD